MLDANIGVGGVNVSISVPVPLVRDEEAAVVDVEDVEEEVLLDVVEEVLADEVDETVLLEEAEDEDVGGTVELVVE